MCGVQTRYVCVRGGVYGLLLGTGECVLVYACIRTDLILTISAHWPLSGRQILENFRALRAQANFLSNFRKHRSAPNDEDRRAPTLKLDAHDTALWQLAPHGSHHPTSTDRQVHTVHAAPRVGGVEVAWRHLTV